MARILFPVFSLLMCLPTSKLTHVTADASSCWPVAPAFQAGLDAALALAMRVPLRYATKPSSYFMCNTMKLDFFRSSADTLNGMRTNTDWLMSFISAVHIDADVRVVIGVLVVTNAIVAGVPVVVVERFPTAAPSECRECCRRCPTDGTNAHFVGGTR